MIWHAANLTPPVDASSRIAFNSILLAQYYQLQKFLAIEAAGDGPFASAAQLRVLPCRHPVRSVSNFAFKIESTPKMP
jgi:hypothetical protein